MSDQKTLIPVTPAAIAKFLQEAGYQGKVECNNDYCYVYTSAEGWRLSIRFYGDVPKTPDEITRSFQFWSFWSISSDDVPMILDVGNSINNDLRFATAYVRTGKDDNFAEISYDYYCPDGISENTFISLMENFVSVRRTFYERAKERYHQLKEENEDSDEQKKPEIVTH